MTNTREEVAVAKAMFEHEVKRMNAPIELGHYPYLDAATIAIAASNSKYVPMLVEALKAINNEQSCGNHTAQEALNNLPEELRG